jgi:hypothetical protein
MQAGGSGTSISRDALASVIGTIVVSLISASSVFAMAGLHKRDITQGNSLAAQASGLG